MSQIDDATARCPFCGDADLVLGRIAYDGMQSGRCRNCLSSWETVLGLARRASPGPEVAAAIELTDAQVDAEIGTLNMRSLPPKYTPDWCDRIVARHFYALGAAASRAPGPDDAKDAARWRLIEYLLLGDEPHDDAADFHTMIAELAYSHQIDIGINRPTPSTLALIDELVAGYARGRDAAEAAPGAGKP